MQRLGVGPFYVSRVSLSGCGRWVSVVRHGRMGRGGCDLWDRGTGRVAFTAGRRECTDAIVHPSGKTFFGWGGDCGLRVMPTAAPRVRPAPVPGGVTAVGCSADGGVVVAAGFVPRGGNWLAGYAAADGHPREVWRTTPEWSDHPSRVDLTPDGALAVLERVDNYHRRYWPRLELRFATDGLLIKAAPLPPGVRLCGVFADGSAVALGSTWEADDESATGQQIGLFDIERADWRTRQRLPDGDYPAAAVSPDCQQVLAASGGGAILLTADTLAVRQQYTFPTAGRPTCVAFAPDGLTAACGTSKGEVVIWDVD